MADEPQLQKGDSGEWVQYLQKLLQSSGSWSGDVDGSFDDELEQVVMQVQSSKGLSANGVVGAETWASLTGESAAASASTAQETGAVAAGGEQQLGDVPAELVAAGAPPSLDQWTEEQKQGYFVGKEPIEEVSGDTPDNLEVVAMTDTGTDEGEAIA
jgi:peptidoglycan hydrolase-like protein with peptidoglycan-binding domain